MTTLEPFSRDELNVICAILEVRLGKDHPLTRHANMLWQASPVPAGPEEVGQ